MQSKYRTGYFRIVEQREVRRNRWGELVMTPYYIVQRLRWFLRWRTERYWRHKNDSPGSWVTYKFDTEKDALVYINKTNYTTKVLWINV